MPIATITIVHCVHEATGVDAPVLTELLQAIPAELFADTLGSSLPDVIRAIPEVVRAVDVARSDPDDFFMTTKTSGDIEDSIWPPGQKTVDLQAGQSVTPQVSITFDRAVNISLWDEDVSDNDLLGSILIFAEEAGRGEIVKLAHSAIESSYYYVFYEVTE